LEKTTEDEKNKVLEAGLYYRILEKVYDIYKETFSG